MLWKQGLLVTPPIVYDLLNAIMVRPCIPYLLCMPLDVRDLAHWATRCDVVHACRTFRKHLKVVPGGSALCYLSVIM